jgi:trehalose/maltose transport system permease protein
MDGASPLKTLFLVLLPVITPALVTTGLPAFINAWNEFLFALTFTSDNSARAAPVAIGLFSGASQFEYPLGQIMAASVVLTYSQS